MYSNDLYLQTLVQDQERAIAQFQLEQAAWRATRGARLHRRPFAALVTHVRAALGACRVPGRRQTPAARSQGR